MPFTEEELLDLARRAADEAEVYFVTTEETPVTFEANRLKGIMTRQSRNIALRIIKNGRIGFAAGAGPEDAQELVSIALETAQFGAEARFHMPAPASYEEVQVYDPAMETRALERVVEAGQRVIDRIVAHTPGILCEAYLAKRIGAVRILNSAGTSAASSKTTFSARVEGTLIHGTEMLFVGDMLATCHPDLDLSALARETIRQLDLAKETASAPHGEVPVIFTPRGFANAFAMPLSLGISGKTVLQGASPLSHLAGQRCFDPRLSLWDDPTIPYCPGSRAFDDEGVKAQRLPLVEGGVVRNFTYDLQTAGLAGVVSTGSASRMPSTLPAPSISVLTMEPGDASFEDMVADIPEGLIVEEMLGSTQGNVLGGDFGGNVLLGYKIERGRIVGRVKDTMIAGNVYTILKDLQAIGRDAQWVGGSMLVPAITCPRVSVSSKA